VDGLAVVTGALSKIAEAATKRVEGEKGSTSEVVGSFSDALRKAMSEVGDLQMRADDLIQKLSTGKVQDVHQVMIASEEAGLSLQLALQLRNKAIEAYQEIMRMQV
jgi:flagellar hook-basal body complex protein FliE